MQQIPAIGTFGYHAAKTYQAISPAKQHETAVQYTPDITAKGATADLFQYAQTFAQNPDQFTTQELQAASGLNLAKLAKPETLISLWDTNKNGAVDLKEAAVGLVHLDSADGALDGKITQAGRQEIESQFFDDGIRQRITPATAFVAQIDDTLAQQTRLTEDNTTQRQLKGAADKTKGNVWQTYGTHAQAQIIQAQDTYRDEILSQVAEALNIDARHHDFQCACCPK